MPASTDATAPRAPSWPSASAALLLVGGAGLIFLSFMRFSLPELGWVVFAPLLVYVQERATSRSHLLLLLTLVGAFLLAVSKMATSEIPWGPVPMFAVPLALSYFVALTFAGFAHRGLGARWGAYAFASAAVVLGWVQYSFTPGSSWGVLAHTQNDNLPFVQLAALTGLGGMTLLVALGSGLAAAAWSAGCRALRVDLAAFALVLGAALVYGQLRLSNAVAGPWMRVAGIVSPVTHAEFHAALHDMNAVRALDDELFARTERAARLGARAVVWDEIATLTTVPGEAALVARGRTFATEHGVLLLMAYGVIDSLQPLHYANKYRIYLPDGALADEYVKRHPTPADPNDAGTAHAKVVAFDGARVSGGICYDYGFPGIARDNALDGADLALVPASDWRGIDPGHGRMALVNAVAVGLPMVRPVRAATSIMSDPYGRVLASRRADSRTDGVLVADVPAQVVPTLYASTGEVVPLGALGFCVLVAAALVRARGTG